MEDSPIVVDIERGSVPGDTLHFKGKGEQYPQKIPGDVVVELKLHEHEIFTLHGVHLHMSIDVSLKEALLGFERTIIHLDGRHVVITVTTITKPNAVIKVEGEGMPYKGDATQFGNLYVRCHIVMPKRAQLMEQHRQWLHTNLPE